VWRPLLKRKHTSSLVCSAEGHEDLVKADRGVYDSNPVIVISLFLCHHCGVLLQEFVVITRMCMCILLCVLWYLNSVCEYILCTVHVYGDT